MITNITVAGSGEKAIPQEPLLLGFSVFLIMLPDGYCCFNSSIGVCSYPGNLSIYLGKPA